MILIPFVPPEPVSEAQWDEYFKSKMCLVCGWMPYEGMSKYLDIHGTEAECMQCGNDLHLQSQTTYETKETKTGREKEEQLQSHVASVGCNVSPRHYEM